MLNTYKQLLLVAIIQRWEESGRILDKERSGRPHILGYEQSQFIDNLVDESQGEMCSRKLRDQLIKNYADLGISERSVLRARCELGWVFQTTKYCQVIRDMNKSVYTIGVAQEDAKRRNDVILTDESTF